MSISISDKRRLRFKKLTSKIILDFSPNIVADIVKGQKNNITSAFR